MKRIIQTLGVLLALPVSAAHADEPRTLRAIAVEFDPMTTPLGARNLLVTFEPPALPHTSFSAIAFASDFPTWVDDLMSYRNRGEGFDQPTFGRPLPEPHGNRAVRSYERSFPSQPDTHPT